MAVLFFAMTTAVMGCYQKEAEPSDASDDPSTPLCIQHGGATPDHYSRRSSHPYDKDLLTKAKILLEPIVAPAE